MINPLNSVFWDYPEFTDPDILRQRLQQGTQHARRWFLLRFLEHGRVVDTLKYFSLDMIAQELSHLRLTAYTLKKWTRIVEVYGQSQGR